MPTPPRHPNGPPWGALLTLPSKSPLPLVADLRRRAVACVQAALRTSSSLAQAASQLGITYISLHRIAARHPALRADYLRVAALSKKIG